MHDYIVRQANISDTDNIMEFINLYWREGHVLAKNKKLFLWQYEDGEKLNMIIAVNDNAKIYGLLGFVKYGLTLKEDIVLALWKSNSKENPFLGVELLQYLIQAGEGRISCNGINLGTTKDIYEYLGFRIDYLRQYYRLNTNMEYKIAKIKEVKILKTENSIGYQLKKIKKFDELFFYFDFKEYEACKMNPLKSVRYIKHRYFEHPFYNYHLYAVMNGKEKKNTILIMRDISCNNSKLSRIVDCIGNVNSLIGISNAVDQLMYEEKYEYIDFMQYGISEKIMNEAGFVKRLEDDGTIIPDYFEPYECSNVKIWFCTKYKQDFYFFKGDGDQDRPNLLS